MQRNSESQQTRAGSEETLTSLPDATGAKRLLVQFLHNRDFSMLFAGQLISQMGDSMYQIGLLWLVLELTGSNSTMGLVAMISYLPMLLFGIPAGILVDIFDRRRLMLIADFVRAFVVILLPAAYFSGSMTMVMIVTVSFIVASFSTIFNPARDAIVPALVEKSRLLNANSLIQSTHFAAILLGPALGGAVIGLVGVAHLFTVDAITFLLSAVAVMLIRRPLSALAPSRFRDFRDHFFEIIRFIHQHRKLRFLLVLTAVNNFFIMGPAIVGTPIFIKTVLRQDAVSYAIVESCLGVGMIVGSVLVNIHSRYVGKAKLLLLGMMFDGLTLMLVCWTQSLLVFMILIAIHAIGIPHIIVTRTSLIQEWAEGRQLGRVFSLVNMAVIGMTALTTGVTGLLADIITIEAVFGVFGACGMVCGLAGLLHRELRNS